MNKQCPFGKESIDKLKAFIDLMKSRPELLHVPDLAFFRDYLISMGAKLPPAPSPPSETDDEPTPVPPQKEASSPEEEVVVESDPESELEEFDTEGCIEPDVVDETAPQHQQGDVDKESSEEEVQLSHDKRIEAMTSFNDGNAEKAIELLTEAVVLNPTLAVLFVKRGQAFLTLKKPNACIRDCTRALELNPDSAPAYKFRGRAYQLLGNWEQSAQDLRQACKIDLDEQTDEWLKEVTPNAQKIEQHKLKQERKKAEKELRERTDRLRKAKEAHARAATEDFVAGDVGGEGAAGLGEFYKLLQDPEVLAALKEPDVAAAFEDISKNPSNFMKYQSNPKVMDLLAKLSQKVSSSGVKFPGMGGMGGFPGAGMGGFPGGFPGAPPSAPQDDNLD